MTLRRFLLVLAIGVLAAAALLALAAVLDAPFLRFVALAALIGVFVADEAWAWSGHGRAWRIAALALVVGVVALAFELVAD